MNSSQVIKSGITCCLQFVLLAALLPAGPIDHAWADTLYKWVDENGKISYQDYPPPKGAAISQEVLKETTVPTIAGQPELTAEQINPVVVYTVANCNACEIMLLRLKQLGIPNQQQSLLDRTVQARILEITDNLSAPTVFIGDKLLVNDSESNLLKELESAGYQLPESARRNADDSLSEPDQPSTDQ